MHKKWINYLYKKTWVKYRKVIMFTILSAEAVHFTGNGCNTLNSSNQKQPRVMTLTVLMLS